MPLEDNYQTERQLKDSLKAIAEGITEHFKDIGLVTNLGFMVFLVDYRTGRLEYVSDINDDDALIALEAYVKRRKV